MQQVKGKKRYLLALAIVVCTGIVVFLYWDDLGRIVKLLSEGSLEDIVGMIHTWGIFAPLVSILLMILQAFIAPIPSFLITGANGIVFGVGGGIAISWLGAMFGAAGTFYLARFLGADFVQKFEKDNNLIKKVDEISQKHGAKVVFIGRLLPFVSFDFLSYTAGLSTMRAIPFFIATAVGMLPGTVAYVLLGNQILALSRYSTLVTTIVLALLGVLGIVSLVRKKVGQKPAGKGNPTDDE